MNRDPTPHEKESGEPDTRSTEQHHASRQPSEDFDAGGHGERGGQREESRRDNPRMARGIPRHKPQPRTGKQ